ncbi:MAG: DUF1513 domain-containing protein, partial [Dehalococcoidia bacterium]|nr:DUF1513 domain-containing protein [Dehalococcoidia bacterium]
MAIEGRRRWLAGALARGLAGAALLASPAAVRRALSATMPSRPRRIIATWRESGRDVVGVLHPRGGSIDAGARIELPTRAHALALELGGSVLVAARRPGDWLLRWHPDTRRTQWHWAQAGRVFNGHVLHDAARGVIYVTQTDTEADAGEVGVLDARSLAPLDAWPTRGRDPHALLQHDGRLWVANGGIMTVPETGRAKLALERMDSSLVALSPGDGGLQGQWRLADRRLSLRHLAVSGARLGIALQAEHDDPDVRRRAPLLAVLAGERLEVVPWPAATEFVDSGGYGGDVTAWQDGFIVSATRGDRLLGWRPTSGWVKHVTLARAGALLTAGGAVWAGGVGAALRLAAPAGEAQFVLPHALTLDNHWVA